LGATPALLRSSVLASVRARTNPYRLYLYGLSLGGSTLFSVATTTTVVYWVDSGHLNPLQLLLLGTALEIGYFLAQLPTGVLADMVSRRLCVVSGMVISGFGFTLQGLSPAFANLLVAQLVWGAGIALMSGAEEAWIADELNDTEMTPVYMRSTQLGILATIGGSLLAGVLALAGLNMPTIAGGAGMIVFGVWLACAMPENNFRPNRSVRVAGVVHDAWTTLTAQTRSTRRALVAVPGLMLLFGMTFFIGMWSESFDRLWGAFLLRDIAFPHVYGLRPTMWFSLISCAVALLGLGSTELAKRRTARLGPASVAGTLLVLTTLIGAGVAILAGAHVFVVAIGGYLLIEVLRPVFEPLVTGWVVGRIDPAVRATALSAREMFDAGGQIAGGPVVGVIGTLTTIRTALFAGGAALVPAIALLLAATRRIHAQPDAPADDLMPAHPGPVDNAHLGLAQLDVRTVDPDS
jgi:DHA3 family tetracycline resistance protein-like MFS transporter